MNWKEKILSAMLEMKSACKENTEWNKCCECPFIDFCDIIERITGKAPSEWEITAKEE